MNATRNPASATPLPDDAPEPMTSAERGVWVFLITNVGAAIAYGIVVLPRALSQPIEQVSWVAPMLWAIGIQIVGTIVLTILATIGTSIAGGVRGRPVDVDMVTDARDQDIERYGSRNTHGIFATGTMIALVLAMLDADTFWIGNTIFVFGVVAGIVEAVVKIRAYRTGL